VIHYFGLVAVAVDGFVIKCVLNVVAIDNAVFDVELRNVLLFL
jgi:hypothetical protein